MPGAQGPAPSSGVTGSQGPACGRALRHGGRRVLLTGLDQSSCRNGVLPRRWFPANVPVPELGSGASSRGPERPVGPPHCVSCGPSSPRAHRTRQAVLPLARLLSRPAWRTARLLLAPLSSPSACSPLPPAPKLKPGPRKPLLEPQDPGLRGPGPGRQPPPPPSPSTSTGFSGSSPGSGLCCPLGTFQSPNSSRHPSPSWPSPGRPTPLRGGAPPDAPVPCRAEPSPPSSVGRWPFTGPTQPPAPLGSTRARSASVFLSQKRSRDVQAARRRLRGTVGPRGRGDRGPSTEGPGAAGAPGTGPGSGLWAREDWARLEVC